MELAKGMAALHFYKSGSCYQATLLNYPAKLDCGIPAADGLDNSFQTYSRKVFLYFFEVRRVVGTCPLARQAVLAKRHYVS